MKAVAIHQHGGPDRFVYEEGFPDPVPGRDEAIVRVRATSLNDHDVFTRRGMPGINYTGGDTWVPSLRCLRRGGRLLTCGATAGFDPKTDIRYIWTYELKIIGSNGWTREDIEALLGLVESGKLHPVIEDERSFIGAAIRVPGRPPGGPRGPAGAAKQSGRRP